MSACTSTCAGINKVVAFLKNFAIALLHCCHTLKVIKIREYLIQISDRNQNFLDFVVSTLKHTIIIGNETCHVSSYHMSNPAKEMMSQIVGGLFTTFYLVACMESNVHFSR